VQVHLPASLSPPHTSGPTPTTQHNSNRQLYRHCTGCGALNGSRHAKTEPVAPHRLRPPVFCADPQNHISMEAQHSASPTARELSDELEKLKQEAVVRVCCARLGVLSASCVSHAHGSWWWSSLCAVVDLDRLSSSHFPSTPPTPQKKTGRSRCSRCWRSCTPSSFPRRSCRKS